MPHHTREWTFNLYSVIYTVQGGYFLLSEIVQRDMFTLILKLVTKDFYLALCIFEFKFCILEGQAFLN